MSFFVRAFQTIINASGSTLAFLLSLLPSSPFSWDISGLHSSALKIVLWLIPVQDFLTIMSSYIAAAGLYYAIRVILRWVKVAGE